MTLQRRQPNKARVYHVTPRERAEEIKIKGLAPRSNDNPDTDFSGVGYEPGCIYFFDDDVPARQFRNDVENDNPGKEIVILAFDVPDQIFGTAKKDVTFGSHAAFKYEGSFPPGWVAGEV